VTAFSNLADIVVVVVEERVGLDGICVGQSQIGGDGESLWGLPSLIVNHD